MTALTMPRLGVAKRTRATSTGGAGVELAAVPRAHLLPPSVIRVHRERRQARAMIIGLVAAVVVVALGIGAAGALSMSRQNALAAERARTNALVTEQSAYATVAAQMAAVDSLTAARSGLAESDIDWSATLERITATLPDGTALAGATVVATTPVSVVTPSADVLAETGVAEMELIVTAPDLATLERWLAGVRAATGVTEVRFGDLTEEEGGRYRSTATVGLGADALSGRYTTDATQ